MDSAAGGMPFRRVSYQPPGVSARPEALATGAAWYPYYMRRLAERPANVLTGRANDSLTALAEIQRRKARREALNWIGCNVNSLRERSGLGPVLSKAAVRERYVGFHDIDHLT